MSHFARLQSRLRAFPRHGCAKPRSALFGISAVGVTGTIFSTTVFSPRELATVNMAEPACSISSGLREKLVQYQAKKIDSKLSMVHEAERRLLEQMPADTPYEVVDVPVRVDGFGTRCSLIGPEKEFSIHTVVVGMEHTDKVPIVLVHGFMMGAASFWKLLPALARERTVYAIDIIGMAGSSRPPFDSKTFTPEDVEALLCQPFQCWAKALQLERFALLGHSLGGLICAYWATRSPECVACLGLLSPCLGFSDERISKFTQAMNKDVPWQRRAFFSLIQCAWSHHLTPQTLVRWLPGFKGFIGRSTERRYQSMASGVSEEEGKILSEYVVATMDMPASTEAAGAVLFEPFLRPVEVPAGSIKSRLSCLKCMPIFAIYGDRDWMEKPPQQDIPNCEFVVLQGSGHHLALDAPKELAACVLPRLQQHLKD